MTREMECDSCICGKGTDSEVAERQLGRAPEGMIKASARCSYGVPTALLCSPIVARPGRKAKSESQAEPFPTLFWLTCPYMKERVGRLEGGQAFLDIRRRIAEDAVFETRLKQASDDYRRLRRKLYEDLPGELKASVGEKATQDLLASGPGGVKDYRNIKCLHIHLANFISGMDDPVGEEAAKLISCMQDDKEGCPD